MTDDRVLELVSAAADCELDDNDQADLDRLLESMPAAREFEAELRQMDKLFSELPDLDPPTSLHAAIMANAKTAPIASERVAFSLNWLQPLRLGAGLRYALAAAGGALLVMIFFEGPSSISDSVDHSDFVGTIVPSMTAAGVKVVDTFAFRTDGFASQARLERRDGVFLLDIRIDAPQALDVSIDMVGTGLQPDAIAQLESQFESITVAKQTLQLRANGEQQLTILLRRVDDTIVADEAEISLEYSSDSKLLERGALQPNGN